MASGGSGSGPARSEFTKGKGLRDAADTARQAHSLHGRWRVACGPAAPTAVLASSHPLVSHWDFLFPGHLQPTCGCGGGDFHGVCNRVTVGFNPARGALAASSPPVTQVASCSACTGGTWLGSCFPGVNLLLELLCSCPPWHFMYFLSSQPSCTRSRSSPAFVILCKASWLFLFTHSSELENVSCLVSFKALWSF